MLKKIQIFNNNSLKIIALILMTVDHVGFSLLDNNTVFRSIGRLAFPIFAYMIAEGCKYTKNKRKYFFTLIISGVLSQPFYYLLFKSNNLNTLITFVLSISIIFLIEKIPTNYRKILTIPIVCILFVLTTCICPVFNFNFDYGFFGIMLPVVIYFTKSDTLKLFVTAIWLILLSFMFNHIQFFSLFSVLLLLFYNGKRGSLNLKYLFYGYYPLHLLGIYLISLI